MSDLERLNIMIPKKLKASLQTEAESKGLTLSALIRMILTLSR